MNDVMKVLKRVFSVIGGAVIYWLGGIDKLLTVLSVVMILDYVTGFLKGVYQKKSSSKIGFKGIVKKVLLLTIVAVAFVIESLINYSFPLREIVIMFFIANECLSILENATELGVPFPQKLKDILLQLRDSNDKEEQ